MFVHVRLPYSTLILQLFQGEGVDKSGGFCEFITTLSSEFDVHYLTFYHYINVCILDVII